MNKVVLFTLGLLSWGSWAQTMPNTVLDEVSITETLSPIALQKAEAVVLNEEGLVEYQFAEESGFALLLKVKRLIQINSKEGIHHASLLVPFYSNRYTKEEVTIDYYKIYRSNQGQEEVITVDQATNQKINDDFYLKAIKRDDIQVGDRIEYSYTKKIDAIDVIPTWNFQEDIPKLKTSYTVKIPDNLTYMIAKTGHIEVKESQVSTQSSRNLAASNWGTSYRFKEVILQFDARQIPAFQYEPFMDNPQNIRSSIRFDLIQFQYPMNASVVIPHKPEAVAKEIYKGQNFGRELRHDKYWKEELEVLALEGKKESEKAKEIIAFIQRKIKWNQQYGYWAEQGVKRAVKLGEGNSGDINLALIGALRAAGLEAEPIVLSTQSNGKAPLLFARFLNHVIVGLQIEGQFCVVDGTLKPAVLNLLPLEDLNGVGWMITEKQEVTQVELTPRPLSFKQEEFQLTLDEGGTASGEMKSILTRYEALAFNANYTESALNRSRSEIEARSTQLFLKAGEINATGTGDVELEFQVQKFNFATRDDQKNTLTFNPLELYGEKENPFKDKVRYSDVHFMYPLMVGYKLVIQLPDGYKVKTYPKDEVFTGQKTGAIMMYESKVLDGNKLQISLSVRLSKTVIPKEDYSELHLLYQIIQQQLHDKNVVLEKIN